MTHPAFSRGALAAVFALGLATLAPAQVDLQLRGTLDGSLVDLSFGSPGSIAAYGDRLYVGTINGGASVITQVDNPLSAPTIGGTLAGSLTPAGNGYVTLDTDGTTVVAATNNSGAADLLQVFDVATATLRYEALPAELPAPRSRIDGAAIDPLTGNIWVTGFGSGLPNVLGAELVEGAIVDNSDSPSNLFAASPSGTGWRDINFGPTGNLYLRGTNGVVGGDRVGTTDDFTTIESAGATAGLSQIAGGDFTTLQDPGRSALNIELLPASFTGTEDLFITNTRQPLLPVDPVPFGDQVLSFEADAGFDGVSPFSLNGAGVAAPINFLAADGVTPFTTAGSDSGIYDFSFDPVNEILYISDETNGLIYLFGEPVGESGVEGDYNNDGTVDAADYTVYRDNLGAPVTLPNDTTPGTVSSPGDFDVWANNYGSSTVPAAIPEPASALLLVLAGITLAGRRR